MGHNVSKILNRLFANREMRILMLGLDAAGKTSNLLSENFTSTFLIRAAILYKLKLNQQYGLFVLCNF